MTTSAMTARYPECHPDTMFTCRNGSCIAATLVCNGEMDCVDGSDEGPGCHLLTPHTGTTTAYLLTFPVARCINFASKNYNVLLVRTFLFSLCQLLKVFTSLMFQGHDFFTDKISATVF